MTELDLDARYTVEGWRGIAFYCLGPVMVRDEDYEWSGVEEPHPDLVRMVMVGDDEVHEIDRTDLTVIGDDDYCHECGQIGCKATSS